MRLLAVVRPCLTMLSFPLLLKEFGVVAEAAEFVGYRLSGWLSVSEGVSTNRTGCGTNLYPVS